MGPTTKGVLLHSRVGARYILVGEDLFSRRTPMTLSSGLGKNKETKTHEGSRPRDRGKYARRPVGGISRLLPSGMRNE